jgi:hypothetical protein
MNGIKSCADRKRVLQVFSRVRDNKTGKNMIMRKERRVLLLHHQATALVKRR